MRTVIYADVLVVLNIFVNYFLLLSSGMLLREKVPRLRALLGAAVGGASSLTLIMPQMYPAVSAGIKFAALCLTVFAAFGSSGLRAFLRRVLCFLAVNAGFAGAIFALNLALDGRGVLYGNGSFYIDVSFKKLAVCVCAAYAVCAVASRILRKFHPPGGMCMLTVELYGRQAKLKALTDTGNSLREGFSGSQVAVVSFGSIESLLPGGCGEFFSGGAATDDLPENMRSRVRLIPCGTVGGGGVLPAFRSDCARVISERGETDMSGMYIAVTREKLSDEYEALVPVPDTETKSVKRCANEKTCRTDKKINTRHKRPSARTEDLLYQRPADIAAAAHEGGGGNGDDGALRRGRERPGSADSTESEACSVYCKKI